MEIATQNNRLYLSNWSDNTSTSTNPLDGFTGGFFIISTILSVSGTFGNAFVIVVVFANKKLHRIPTYFIMNLSIADLFGCIVWMTLCFYGMIRKISLLPDLCITLVLTMLAAFGVSTLSLALVAINRFCLITRNKTIYNKVFTKCNLVWMILATWLWGLATITPGIVIFSGRTGAQSTWTFALCPTDRSITAWVGLRHFMSLAGAIVALCVATICYFRIWRTVTKSRKRACKNDIVRMNEAKNRRRELQLTRDLCILFGVFSICVTPYIIFQLIDWNYTLLPIAVHRVGVLLMWTNSVCNPYFYCWRNKEFRNTARKLLAAICSGREPVNESVSQRRQVEETVTTIRKPIELL